ncbi:MAG: GTP-binding protein [Flavobacteriaceae bacterium]
MNQEIFLRPRFVLPSEKSQNKIIENFLEAKNKAEQKFIIKIVDEHVFIDVSKKESHFWSPQLHLEILQKEDKAEVKGLFGPKPQVWTFFMFLHFIVGVGFLGTGVWLYVNYSLEKNLVIPTILLIMLPMLWVLLYFVGRLGRDFGKNQIKKQHQFMMKILEG